MQTIRNIGLEKTEELFCPLCGSNQGIFSRERERERERERLQQDITNLTNKPNKTAEEEADLENKKKEISRFRTQSKK